MKSLFEKKVESWIKKRIPFYEKKLFKDKITSWKELENLINCRPFVSNARMKIPYGYTYNWYWQQWLSDKNSYPPSVVKRIMDTHWFYLCDCSRISKKINNICKYLEELTKMPCDAHIFVSLEKGGKYDNQSFGRHKDTQDNLIVCVEGSQKMQLFREDNPTEIEFEDVFSPGDAIYIPAGRFHKVIGTGKKRLSISFPMIPGPTTHAAQEREWIEIDDK
tara:strand:- start:273 stop:932 length:660 start_codon:yes stop_codon:yes gene_type:complete